MARQSTIFTPEEELTHFLLLNAPLMPDLGILNGKMKAVIHFLEQHRQTKNDLYQDFAFELLEDIHDAVSEKFPICFGHGLCGIGWGTEYLIKHRFLATDEDICARYDEAITRYTRQERYDGIGLYNGLCGILLYWLGRLESLSIRGDLQKKNDIQTQTKLTVKLLLEQTTQENANALYTEMDNADFNGNRLLIYSKWEYPILLNSLLQLYKFDIQQNDVVQIIIRILNAMEQNIAPSSAINRGLLQRELNTANQLLQLPKNVSEIALRFLQ